MKRAVAARFACFALPALPALPALSALPALPALLALIAAFAVLPAHAQDFAAPHATPLSAGAFGLLEDALPARERGIALSVATTQWYGTGLTTRALTLGTGWRALRASAGLSQTGEPDIGWTALALGVGVVEHDCGAGARVIARRDRTSDFTFDAPPGAIGAEVGAGAWLSLGARLVMWVNEASIASSGQTAPLARPLESGVVLTSPALTLWLAHSAAPAAYGSAGFAAGMAAPLGPARLWLTARDAPLRGTLGLSLALPLVGVAAEVESHPSLEPVSRLSVTLGSGGP